MRWRKTRLVCVAAAAMCAGACAAGSEPEAAAAGAPAAGMVDLAPKYEAEQTTTYEQTLRIVQKQTIEAQRNKQLVAELTRRFTLHVLEAREGGGATVAMAFNRIQLRVQPPEMAVFEFDSRSPDSKNPGNPKSMMLRRMMDAKVIFHMGASGVVDSVEGMDSVKRAFAENPGSEDISAFFGEKAFRELAEEIFGVGAENPERRVGDEWEKGSFTEVGGVANVPLTLNCKLASAADGIATISGTGRFEVGKLKPVIAGAETKVKDQLLQFVIKWSLTRGRLEQSNVDQSIILSQGIPEIPVSATLATNGELRRVETDSN